MSFQRDYYIKCLAVSNVVPKSVLWVFKTALRQDTVEHWGKMNFVVLFVTEQNTIEIRLAMSTHLFQYIVTNNTITLSPSVLRLHVIVITPLSQMHLSFLVRSFDSLLLQPLNHHRWEFNPQLENNNDHNISYCQKEEKEVRERAVSLVFFGKWMTTQPCMESYLQIHWNYILHNHICNLEIGGRGKSQAKDNTIM